MGNHKKNIRAEKAKVKLKGAKLPKGLNVTKTEFKVKKIVLRDQLDEQFEDGKKIITIKECLSKLKHHNTTIKLEALRSLKVVLISNTPEVIKNLNIIVQAVCHLTLDIESGVRKECLKFIGDLFSTINADTLEPFYNIFSSYIRCGMTHIQIGIQEDSLLFLDALLKHLPKMVFLNTKHIFEDFIDMISKLRAGSKPGRVLTVHVDSKVNTVKWREKILMKLNSMLNNIIKYKTLGLSSNIAASKQISFDCNVPVFCSLLYGYGNNNKNINSRGNIMEEVTYFKGYVEQLMPLIWETWLEVAPRDSSSAIRTDSSSSFTLTIILDIISQLFDLVKIFDKELNNTSFSVWFKKYKIDFSNYFLKHFPYNEVSNDIMLLNLNICYLYLVYFEGDLKSFDNGKYNEIILNYIYDFLRSNPNFDFRKKDGLNKLLRQTFFSNGIELYEINRANYIPLLKLVLTQFSEYRENSLLLVTLCDMVSSQKFSKISNVFSDWIPCLPELLLKSSITQHMLITFINLAKQKNQIFLSSVRENMLKITQNIGNIHVIGARNQLEGKKYIMQLFYWLDLKNNEKDEVLKILEELDLKDKRILPCFSTILAIPNSLNIYM